MRNARKGSRIVVARVVFAVSIAVQGGARCEGADPPPRKEAAALMDPRLEELRFASVSWENRDNPRREVVDVLCLVPDVPTFLEALRAWDGRHAFPILIDEPELVLKFRRAFRPARVVRFPKRAEPIPEGKLWEAAVSAVGHSWAVGKGQAGPGDGPPRGIEPTPAGVVLSEPGSPSLAGGVALAAGRFQPLIRWGPGRKRGEPLTAPAAEEMAIDLERKVAAVVPNYARMGDDCDFLTLAGDWPDRYDAVKDRSAQPGPASFDDLVGRRADRGSRWAFAGRLGGDAATSVYRAMCSLFLQPKEVLLFNGYALDGDPWGKYHMQSAARRLAREGLEVEHLAGPEQATVAGWHRALDPVSPFALASINSHGSPTVFNLQGGPAVTADVPLSVPAAILMIHSFSAFEPTDPATIAGRWLANGAFLYFGSLNEPYLSSFRTPTLQADLIAEGLPFAAVARISTAESFPFGHPWRLHFLGDPLYRLRREGARKESWEPVASWPSLRPGPPPAPTASPLATVHWAYQMLLDPEPAVPVDDVAVRLLSFRRDTLAPELRPRFDAIFCDALASARRINDLREALGRIAPEESSPDIRRWLETIRVIQLQAALNADKFKGAAAMWSELIRSRSSTDEMKGMLTTRVAAKATTPALRREWLGRLEKTRDEMGPTGTFVGPLEKEIERVRLELK